MRLRVASYNLRGLQDDVSALARTVRAIDPDVLCVQEVPWIGPAGHRIADFAQRASLVWSGRTVRAGETSILTSQRVEAQWVSHHKLRTARRLDRRGYAVARVAPFGGSAVTIASVHLSLDAEERPHHTRQILTHLGTLPGPTVVGGDINEESDGDAWHLVAEGLDPVTPLTPTFPANRPDRVLDVIFASREVSVLEHREVPWLFEDLVAASDHRPVWVDIDVPERGRSGPS